MKEGFVSTMIGFAVMLILLGVSGWAAIEIKPEPRPYLVHADKQMIAIYGARALSEHTKILNDRMELQALQVKSVGR
jgi:hypothetical protein